VLVSAELCVIPMIEKHHAIWMDVEADNSGTIVSEDYLPELGKLFIVYMRRDGGFMPFSYVKQHDPQYSLPIWSNENTKVLLASLEEAKQYLESFRANT
jgi:hypothetical protein